MSVTVGWVRRWGDHWQQLHHHQEGVSKEETCAAINRCLRKIKFQLTHVSHVPQIFSLYNLTLKHSNHLFLKVWV